MKREQHLLFGIIFLIIVAYIFERITITLVFSAIIYSVIPDIDLIFKEYLGHRNIILHSIIPWFIIWCFNPYTTFVLNMSVVGVHCLLDCRWNRNKQRGFYTITTWNRCKRLNGRWSTVWLLSNFAVSFTFLLVWCLL